MTTKKKTPAKATTKAKKTAVKKKSTKLTLEGAKKRIAELEQNVEDGGSLIRRARSERDELGEAAANYQRRYMSECERGGNLEDHVLELRGTIEDLWAQIDMLKRMLAGSVAVAKGVTACEAARSVVRHNSLAVVAKTHKSSGAGLITKTYRWEGRDEKAPDGG